MGAATWFSGVELLDPATVISLDLRTSRLERVRYWTWSDLPPCAAPRDLDETACKLGDLFRRAVARRCRRGERIGISLSGGLDSRAIFAALPQFVEPVEAYTFGKRGCADIRIAQQVAALRPSHHRTCLIDPDDWLDQRVEGVWRTDGQYNLLHMHGAACAEEHRDFFDIRMNGFLGDAFLGGAYGGHPGGEIERFRNHSRRFIALGYTSGNFAYHTRIPFADNELVELTLSIPWSFRRNWSMYHRMLLTTFPDYFSTIPWEEVGLPISKTGVAAKLHALARRAARKIGGSLPFIPVTDVYTEYSAWLRRPHARGFLGRLLGRRDALLFEFVNPRTVALRLRQNDAGFDCADKLGRYLTFELWLRQFFRNEFMDFSAEGVRMSLARLDE
jgi:asparagine synthase (glutamine-hydrolysing)